MKPPDKGVEKNGAYQPSQASHVASMINGDDGFFAKDSRRRKLAMADMCHTLLLMSWPKFISLIMAVYVVMNLIFAVIYFALGPNGFEGIRASSAWARFADCFFFSVQTLATIGYGHISPVGFWPNIVVTIQAFLGILLVAVITGVFYGRFSKPTARVVFSKHALISSFNGRPCLIFRLANERLNSIVEAHMTASMTQNEISQEGEMTRRFYDLALERDFSPIENIHDTVDI